MKKMLKATMILALVTISANFAIGQIPVSPGEGTLSQALMDAYDGDVFQLIGGAEYTESTNLNFGTIAGMSITIEAEDGATEMPKVIMKTTAGEEEIARFFLVGDAASLTLRGIEFDGGTETDTATNFLTYSMGEAPQPITVNTVRVEGCVIKNLLEDVITAGNGDMAGNVLVDSLIVDDCIVTNTDSPIMMKYAGLNYIQVTNSTIHNTNSYGIRVAGPGNSGFPDNTPTVLIDHITMYKIGVGDDQREMIQGAKGPFANPWTVSNSILVNQLAEGKAFINIKDTPGDAGATISSICFWDIVKIDFKEHAVTDTLRMDPGFANPDNGDFTLPADSPTFTYGTDGGPIGDPRWLDNYSVAIDKESVPTQFKLEQNYPNPFNPTTMISFNLEKDAQTSLVVFDALGREIEEVVSERLTSGSYRYDFNASNLQSGIYFYKLTSDGMTQTRKMMLIK